MERKLVDYVAAIHRGDINRIETHCRFIEFIERKLVDYAATGHRGDIDRIGILQVHRVHREETSRLCSN